MSHKQILGQLALSAALGFTGAASAVNIGGGEVSVATSTLDAKTEVANQSSSYTPPSVITLGKLAATSGNLANVKSCYNELGIEEKPMSQTKATDAQRVLNCADKNNLDVFLADPALKRNEISEIVSRWGGVHTAAEILDNENFAKRIATECKVKETTDAFANCAADSYVSNEGRRVNIKVGLAIAGTFIFSAVAAVGAFKFSTPRKPGYY